MTLYNKAIDTQNIDSSGIILETDDNGKIKINQG